VTSQYEMTEARAATAGWLRSHCQRFVEDLNASGYAPCTLRRYGDVALRFCAAVEARGLGANDLDGSQTEYIYAAVLDTTAAIYRTNTRFCLNRFINHLVAVGVARLPEPPLKVPTALELLHQEYETYLRNQRGLSDRTIYHCHRFMDRFITFRFSKGLGDLDDISSDDIVAFLCKIRSGDKPYRDKTPPSHLRAMFRFLFWSGKTKRDLANAVPRVALPAQSHLPRYLSPETVEQLVASVEADDPVARRNRAMLLLVARLGLRAPEVIAIRLDDIDWRAGTILIRGKGKRHDRMPLPEDAGKAIVDYIRNGRRGPSRILFVSSRPPYSPFGDAQILNFILRDAFDRTGLEPPPKYVGSHVLRHSLATDMLRKGASLDEIGDVLRHRSRVSTTIYAKHDIEGLRSIAREWPPQGGRS
jgi:integrase/recombinase XerD